MKFAVVTGGSGGIGYAVTEKLTDDGFCVFSQYFRNKRVPDGATGVYGDFSSSEGVNAFADEIEGKNVPVDVLVNCAGIALEKPLSDVSDEEIRRVMDIDLNSVVILTKRLSKGMISRKRGSIVNVSSCWGVFGGSCETVYSAAKGGIIAFTKALSRELGPSNIRVNCVCPGYIDTEMNRDHTQEDVEKFLEGVSLGRVGTAREVASAIAFLAGDDSKYITGQVLGIDGGF